MSSLLLLLLFQKSLFITRSNQILVIPRSDSINGPVPIGSRSQWSCYVDRCWIRNFVTTIGYFISNIAIVTIRKVSGNIHNNMFSLVLIACIYSKKLTTYTCLSNMACPNRVVSRTTIASVSRIGPRFFFNHSDCMENNVCTHVANCLCAHERVILVFISRVVQQRGK